MDKNQIKELIGKMTPEEKAGQLTQLPTRLYGKCYSELTGTDNKLHITDQEKWLAGSLLGPLDADSMRNIQKENLSRSRLGIPMMFMTDIIHGYRTIFPVPLALSCSFDTSLAWKCARYSAEEGSSAGYQVTFSPMVDLVRDPRWGRVMESFGEDSRLSCEFGRAMVQGYQGDDLKNSSTLAACAKHFVGYGAAEGGRDYNQADVSDYTLYNQYLPSFQACIASNAKLVMAAFQSINGVPATANKHFLKKILRDELGFNGVTISDWNAVLELIYHGVAENEKDAAELALEAGIQIEMASAAILKNIRLLLKKNPAFQSILDEAVEKILTLKAELGLFDDPYRGVSREKEQKTLLSAKNRSAALLAAQESSVLLKNTGVLPLRKECRIVLVGPYADSRDIIGPWSIDAQIEDTVSVLEGLKNRGGNIIETIQTGFEHITPEETERILSSAKRADLVLLALGEPVVWSGEAGSRSLIEIPEDQCAILKKLHESGVRTAVLLFNGRPLDLRPVLPMADAILEMWFPGTEGGNAAADLIYGKVNPSGHLTMSFPYGSGQIPVYYNRGRTGRPAEFLQYEPRYKSQYLDIPNEPLLPFGFGLSYTKYCVRKNGEIKKRQDGKYVIPIWVSNAGEMEGKIVLQIYMHKVKSAVSRPVQELVTWKKVLLKAGEERKIEIVLDPHVWDYWIPGEGWTKDIGNYIITAGTDSQHKDVKWELTVD